MSVVSCIGKEKIRINENEFILKENYVDDGYEWINVKYKYDKNIVQIGAYYIYNYSTSIEWMSYNENYIALVAMYTGYGASNNLKVKKLFDIRSKQFIDGSREELLEIYYREIYNRGLEENSKKKQKIKKIISK